LTTYRLGAVVIGAAHRATASSTSSTAVSTSPWSAPRGP